MATGITPGTRTMSAGAAWEEIARVVGGEHVRDATPTDAIDGVQPQKVAEPATAEEVARVLAVANSAGIRVAARGNGTKLRWGNPPQALELVLSLGRMNRVLEHAWADMTATVEAGCTVAELQRTLTQHGQRLALDPLWPERATVGGILATNDSGALRARFGSLRDLIIGITLALPDGTLAKSGGKVVKNVAGYDLPKLATGSLGTLGVITQAIFRLHPAPQATRTLTFTADTVAQLNQLSLAVQASKLAYTGLQIRAASGEAPQCDVRFAGPTVGIEAQTRELLGIAAKFAKEIDSAEDVWSRREALFEGVPAMVLKVTTLPSAIHVIGETVDRLGGKWRLIAQGAGVMLVRIESDATAMTALNTVRTEARKHGGSAVVLACPAEIKAQVEVWGPAGDALPLMRRIKEQFDPAGTLNPGRFVGGI